MYTNKEEEYILYIYILIKGPFIIIYNKIELIFGVIIHQHKTILEVENITSSFVLFTYSC